jgi:hypothetical protein
MLTAYKKETHERAIVTGREFKRIESDVILILQKVEELRIFLDLGKSSLHQYAVEVMKLSDNVASNYILSARKCTMIPVLQEAIKDGSVSVSNVRKAASVLTLENKEQWPVWIDKMKTLSSKKLEREVAKENPRAATPERMKYVSENRLELQVGISQEMSEGIKRIQDLESKRTGKSVTIEDALQVSVHAYLEKNDPIKKAARILSKKLTALRHSNPAIQSGKKAIPAFEKHQVITRDQGQCTYINDGKRCENSRFTETHHIIARALGGDHSVENLTTLCSAHHKMVHRESKL